MITKDAGLGEETNKFKKGEWVFINPDEGASWWRCALLNEDTVKKFPFKVSGFKAKGTMIWYRCEKNGAVIDNIPEDRVSLAQDFEPANPKWMERAKNDREVVEIKEETKEEVKEKEEIVIQEPPKDERPSTSKVKRKAV